MYNLIKKFAETFQWDQGQTQQSMSMTKAKEYTKIKLRRSNVRAWKLKN